MISFEPLFCTMKQKGVSSYRLQQLGFSRATYYAIRHGNGISTHTIDQLCTILDCDVSDVIKYIPEKGDVFFKK